MKYLKDIVKKYKILVYLYLLIGIALSFSTNFSANYYQKIIDSFTEGGLTFGSIAIYGCILIVICIGNYLDEYPGVKLKNEIFMELKIQALKKISRIDYKKYQSIGTGKLIQRVENGAEAGTNILFDFYFHIARTLVPSILFSMIFIFRMSKIVACCVMIGYILVFIITDVLLKVLYSLKEKILNNEEKINHYLTRGFMEMVVFRVNKRFKREIKKAEKAKGEIVDSKIKMTLIHEAFFTIFALLITFVKISIIFYAFIAKTISIGMVVALVTLVDNAYTPIAIFNVLFVQYKLDKTAYSRYAEFLNEKEDNQLFFGKRIERLKGDIIISNLSFQYDNQVILNNFTLEMKQGQKIAFVGESGSGKSTLVKLIVGLLKYRTGNITVGNDDLDQIYLQDYYKHIIYIPQESPIFDGTLRENIVFDKEVSDEIIIKVLQKVNLYEFYLKQKDGFDTMMGERGIILSGGERQRLALARLWFEESSVVILDEATSAMDNITEEMVMKEVLSMLEESTVITIVHRLNSIKNFDRILAFKDGKIVGEGTFDSLINSNKYFNELYNTSIVSQ